MHPDLLLFASRKKSRSNAIVNREIENARAVWRYADRNRYDVGEMPDWRVMRLKCPSRPPRELSFDEEDRLLPALRSDLRSAVEFMLKSSWRRGEVLNLRWSDCDLQNGTAVTRIKGGNIVSRPLTNSMMALVSSQPKVGPFVFTYVCQQSRDKRRKGERYPLTPTALRGPFEKALEVAGIAHFRLHDLRHTRGTRIVRQTGSLATAKEALKHKSVTTTLRYAHVFDDDTRRALDASDSRNSPESRGFIEEKPARSRAL